MYGLIEEHGKMILTNSWGGLTVFNPKFIESPASSISYLTYIINSSGYTWFTTRQRNIMDYAPEDKNKWASHCRLIWYKKNSKSFLTIIFFFFFHSFFLVISITSTVEAYSGINRYVSDTIYVSTMYGSRMLCIYNSQCRVSIK